MNDSMVSTTPPPTDWRTDPTLNEKWKKRFAFYDSVPLSSGFKSSPELKAAVKQLPARERRLVAVNFFGLFFSFIYLGLVLKLWRQALMALAAFVAIGVVVGMFSPPDNAVRAMSLVVSLWVAFRTNYWYYLKRVKGDIGWTL